MSLNSNKRISYFHPKLVVDTINDKVQKSYVFDLNSLFYEEVMQHRRLYMYIVRRKIGTLYK